MFLSTGLRKRGTSGVLETVNSSGDWHGPAESSGSCLDEISIPIGSGASELSTIVFIALSVVILVATSESGRAQEIPASSWTANSQQSDPNGTLNPTRSRTTHSEVGGRVVDKTVTETLGPDGRYIPYSEVERETVRVSDTTVRTVERAYGRDADGKRMLTQQSQEEARSFSDGSKTVSRTTSNPDGNGALQVVQRSEMDSKVVSPGVRDTSTTIFSANGSGGMGATARIDEHERRTDAATVEYTKSTSLADGAGHWTLSETREGTTRQDSAGLTKEERVLRPNADGKMALVERTVTRDPAGGQGGTSETYSTNLPGQAGDEGLKLVKREITVRRSGIGGDRQTVRQVEQPTPGDPGTGMHVTQEAIDVVRPGVSGTSQQQSTIVTRDANGQMNTVWVDIGSSNKPAPVQAEKAATKKSK